MLFKKSNKVFIHVDYDSFFASCEILRNPSLKWKFVCVWWDIIIACTYNCKALWIKTWTPIWEAKRILRDKWVYFTPDHAYYEENSQKIFKYLESNTLSLEPFSIDEAFCEITGIPEYYKIDTCIKAKIYSKINKPFGIYIGFNQERKISLFKKLEVSKIPFSDIILVYWQETYWYPSKNWINHTQ